MLQALASARPWDHDPDVFEMPWRSEQEVGSPSAESPLRLSFGLMESDGVVNPHPPIARALRIVKAALEAKNHTVSILTRPWHTRLLIALSFARGTLRRIRKPLSCMYVGHCRVREQSSC